MSERYYRTPRHGLIVRVTADFAAKQGLTPVVVIDPTDTEAVERLAKALLDAEADADCAYFEDDKAALRAALHEFANPTPPKPEEPTGLGAVVEAVCVCQDDVRRFVRDPDARDFNLPRDAKSASVGGVPWVSRCGHHAYADLAVVKILSEGVTE